MTSFFDEIAKNRLKSIVLLLLFSLFFLFVFWIFLGFIGGGASTLFVGAIFLALYALFIYFSGDRMVLALSRAQEADPKQFRTLYSVVEGLAVANQIPVPKVYIMNDQNPNAFATGRNRKHASVAVTTGLLSMMSRNELQGVLAHEISHIEDNDIQFMMVAVVFARAIGQEGKRTRRNYSNVALDRMT